MITVRLTGGMGNQMFQFGAARRLALRRRTKVRLSLDWFNNRPRFWPRPFRLGDFHLAEDEDVETTETPWSVLVRAAGQDGAIVYDDRSRRSFQEVLDLPDGTLLRGYFQNENYFVDVQDRIRADLELRDLQRAARVGREMEAFKRPERSLVSVHVRRGDYLVISPDEALLINIARIRNAMARFPGAEFVVFSDDKPWCAENLCGESVHLSPFESDLDELIAMSRCDHHIIANSTFGWWGAWLNPSPGKVVMTPQNWHAGQWPGRPLVEHAEQTNPDDIGVGSWIRY